MGVGSGTLSGRLQKNKCGALLEKKKSYRWQTHRLEAYNWCAESYIVLSSARFKDGPQEVSR